MSPPLHLGPSVVARAPLRSPRRALFIGVSMLAIAASAAQAQTVVGAGQTVTNNGTTTNFYQLTGNGGTLINLGPVATGTSASVEAEIQPFSPSDLSTFRIAGVT